MNIFMNAWVFVQVFEYRRTNTWMFEFNIERVLCGFGFDLVFLSVIWCQKYDFKCYNIVLDHLGLIRGQNKRKSKFSEKFCLPCRDMMWPCRDMVKSCLKIRVPGHFLSMTPYHVATCGEHVATYAPREHFWIRLCTSRHTDEQLATCYEHVATYGGHVAACLARSPENAPFWSKTYCFQF